MARYHGGPNTRMHGPKTARYTRTVMAFYKRGFDPFPGETDDKGYLTNTQMAMLSIER